MTEMTKTTDNMDLLSFIVALIAAPVAVFAISLPFGDVSLITGFAILFGGPCYLLLGAPAFWIALSRGVRSVLAIAMIGLLVNLGSPILATLYFGATEGTFRDAGFFAGIYLTYGSVFAFLWSLVFGLLYTQLDRLRR